MPLRTALLLVSALTLLTAASAGAGAGAPALAASAIEGADFDFVLADLAKDTAYVKYGAVTLQANGTTEARFWTGNQREPIPAQSGAGPLSPVVEIPAGPGFHDGGAKVLSHPAAFRGGARHAAGNWWLAGNTLCIRFEDNFAIAFNPVPLVPQDQWGLVLTNRENPTACEPRAAAKVSSRAPDAIVGALAQHVADRTSAKISVKFAPFVGVISRLNGWDRNCEVFKWTKTPLNFRSDMFTSAGTDIWRSVTMEPQKSGPPMAVFSYLSLSQRAVPEIGRVVVMDVGHDFNRNGRIDDDWGHIYGGFPILSKAGELGGLLMFDFSPVGIREIPYKGGCTASDGKQLTHTLGLILYLSSELHPAL